MFITNANGFSGARLGMVILAACAACGRAAVAATPVPRIATATESVQRIDDYAAALGAAQAANGMLLVSVEPQSGNPTDLAGQHLERPDVQDRFARSGTPWIFCRLGMAEAAGLGFLPVADEHYDFALRSDPRDPEAIALFEAALHEARTDLERLGFVPSQPPA